MPCEADVSGARRTMAAIDAANRRRMGLGSWQNESGAVAGILHQLRPAVKEDCRSATVWFPAAPPFAFPSTPILTTRRHRLAGFRVRTSSAITVHEHAAGVADVPA